MRILYVTNMYPTEQKPYFGIFVKEQIEDVAQVIDLDYDVHFINARENGPCEYLKSIFTIPRQIRREKYDLIHIHYGFSGLWRLFYKPKAKVFLSLHGADILPEQGKRIQVAITNRLLKRVDRVFTLNDRMDELVQSRTNNFERLPCAVNINQFKPKENTPAVSDKKTIIFPSAPHVEVKDYPLFERVISALQQKTNHEIEVKCIQNLTRQGVSDLMSSGDCMVMTSVSEGSPQVVKEALSCGLPVVSVDVGDVASMTKDIPNCFIAQSRSPEELSELVLKTFGFDRQQIRQSFINKGIYDHISITKRWVDLYHQATGKGNITVYQNELMETSK